MYDPLVDKTPPCSFERPDSIWAENTVGERHSELTTELSTDVVIVGGGYTGLSCAYHLASEYQTDCVVVEANQPGWGCSGRNGGFVLPGTGRLNMQQMSKRWGEDAAKSVYKEYLASIDLVKSYIQMGISCDMTCGGYLKLAHAPHYLEPLHRQASIIAKTYGDAVEPLSQSQVKDTFVGGSASFGGVFYPDAFGVNPWLLCNGIARLAVQSGVRIYGSSPVVSITEDGNHHRVVTPKGTVRAKYLVLASNAYGQARLHQTLRNRMFPVLSSIIVTEPLNTEQLLQIGMREGLMVMDTRALKYYYRILPDNRLLFGGRGAIRGANAHDPRYKTALLNGLLETFPSIKGIAIDAFWSGWVSVSYDDFPRVYRDKTTNTCYAGGYCGAGLAFSLQAGKRLSQLIKAPEKVATLPFMQSPLKPFPLAFLRRPALQGFYWYEGIKRRLGI